MDFAFSIQNLNRWNDTIRLRKLEEKKRKNRFTTGTGSIRLIQLNRISTTANSFHKTNRIESHFFPILILHTRRRDEFNEVIFLRLYLFFKVKANRKTPSQPVKWQNNQIDRKSTIETKMPQFCLYYTCTSIWMWDVGRLMNIRIRYTMTSAH